MPNTGSLRMNQAEPAIGLSRSRPVSPQDDDRASEFAKVVAEGEQYGRNAVHSDDVKVRSEACQDKIDQGEGNKARLKFGEL